MDRTQWIKETRLKTKDMLYCIEVDRSGLPEEDMVLHHKFDKEPTQKEVKKVIEDEGCGYKDDYCSFRYYQVG